MAKNRNQTASDEQAGESAGVVELAGTNAVVELTAAQAEKVGKIIDGETSEDGGDWTPKDYAEFLASDEGAMGVLRTKLEWRTPVKTPSDLPIPRTLGVGSPCVYFDLGEDTREPRPATVLRTDGDGCLSVAIYVGGGKCIDRHNVYRLDDPRLDAKPELRKAGCWDTVGRAEQRRADRTRIRREQVQREAAARRERSETARRLREEQGPRLVDLVLRQKVTVDAAIAMLNQGGDHWTLPYAHTYLRKADRVDAIDVPDPLPTGVSPEDVPELAQV